MLKWLWLSLVALVLDQWSKIAIDGSMRLYESISIFPYFNLTYVHNTGAAFSFLSEAGGWQRWFFAAMALIISVVLAIWLSRLKKHETLINILLFLNFVGLGVLQIYQKVLVARTFNYIELGFIIQSICLALVIISRKQESRNF